MTAAPNTTFALRVEAALANATMKKGIGRTTGNARIKRASAVAAWPEFEAARLLAAQIKDHVTEHLEHYLLQFERNAVAAGAEVHWARTSEEACAIVIALCRSVDAKSVTRAKSMLGEEIGLPHALEAAGIRRVETDLAEHIIQLAGDPPSHIVWPAAHRTREEVSVLFQTHHRDHALNVEVPAMVASAREELREDFLAADVGISGANFLVADTGAVCTVTNEGNAELTTTLPRMHIVTAGIEKLVPSTEHALQLVRLLVRSATGAELTQYTTFHCGARREGDRDGPTQFHIVLVDNGRTRMLAEGLAEMLRCIRCGACMNHCVVYRQIGGHAYGGTYPGPMGAVLTPVLDGLRQTRDLAQACTLNGQCQQVCPVAIPLPKLLRGWREKSWREGLEPATVRTALGLWAFFARHPRLYRAATAVALPLMRLFGDKGWIERMPLAGAWTAQRSLPRPPGQSFMAQYAAQQRRRQP